MRKLITSIAILCCAVAANAQQGQTTTIEPLRGEKWYAMQQEAAFRPNLIVSGAGRYIWNSSPMDISFDGDKITVVSDRRAEPQKGGRTLREAYLTGRHKYMPPGDKSSIPASLFSAPVYDMSMNGMELQGQDNIIRCADALLKAGMPAGTILIADGWQSISALNDFDRELYPDPAGMVRALREKGFKVMLTVTPYVRAAGKNFASFKGMGLLLTDRDNRAAVFETPAGYSACIDITADGGRFSRSVSELKRKYAIDGFLFDCGKGLEAAREDYRVNAFVNEWKRLASGFDMAAYTSPLCAGPEQAAIVPLKKEGNVTWAGMASAVGSAMSAGLSGYIYTQYSYGTVPMNPADGIAHHAAQLGLFLPVPVLPLDCLGNEKYMAELVRAANFRASLAGYMDTLLKESSQTAEPVIRHLDYQFPGQGFGNCNDQFMLGGRYLVAPVLDSSSTRTVRLPKGTWVDANGARHRGPRVINVNVGDGRLPVFTLQ